MATVVNEGAGGEGGNLFEGKKIWVSLNVSKRRRLVTGIKSNGGTITGIEKEADLMIADCKPDAPNGSYSWEYIDSALREGRLPDLDDYLIKPKESVRAAGVSKPGKITKTPFTDDDDKFLYQWVLRGEKQGYSLKGNELYKDLERVNNRHPYQSWRDHWIKVLSLRKRPELDSEDEQVDSPAVVPPQARQEVRLRQASNTLESGIKSRASRPKGVSRASTPILHAQPSPQKPATSEDMKELLNNYDSILNIDDTKDVEAWNAWSTEFPQHTAEEWKEIWINDVKPLRQGKSSPNKNQSGDASKNVVSSFFRSSEVASESRPGENQRSSSTPSRGIPQRYSPETSSHGQKVDVAKSRLSTVTTPNSEGSRRPSLPPRNSAQNSSLPLSQEQSGDEGLSLGVNEEGVLFQEHTLAEDAKRSENIPKPWISPRPSEIRSPSLRDRKKFDRYILLFSQEQNLGINLTPVIEGKEISLYEIYLYVKERGGSKTVDRERLWPQIVTKLGFNVFREKNACQEIRTVFETYLMDFEDFRDENEGRWKAEHRSASATNSAGDSEEDQNDIDAPYTLSKAPKRQLSPAQQEAGSTAIQVKRRRVDKGKGVDRDEIPSTPEATFKNQVLYENSFSPLRQGQTTTVGEIEDGVWDVFSEPLERNIISKTGATVAQDPETQDFHYPISDVDSEDVHYPASDFGDDDLNYPNSPERPGTTESQLLDMEDDLEVIKYRDYYMSLGYTKEAVDGAMRITTMDLDLMPQIMELLNRSQGSEEEAVIPDNIRGVWTEEDDQDILEKRDLRRIVEKHSVDRVEMRELFLRDMVFLRGTAVE